MGNWEKDNKLRGTGEDDVIYGGRMNDNLRGGFGNDILLGFGGNDKLKGGNGDDVLYSGNTGRTKMKGGEGSDTFYLSKGYGSYSVIKDFDPIFDTIFVPGEYELEYKDNLTKIMMGYCGSGVSLSSYFGTRLGQRIAGLPEGETPLTLVPFQTRPLYSGNPWFLAPSILFYQMKDRYFS